MIARYVDRIYVCVCSFFFFQAEDGIRDIGVTGVQTCALPIYESLLRSKRQQIHARIASALEEHHPAVIEMEPETIAQHLTEAGLTGKAVNYWLQAGRIAAGRSANLEAISHLLNGLEALKDCARGAERDRQELALQTAIGGPLIAIHGY